MTFAQPCFIRKNTAELINKLEELGYTQSSCGWYVPVPEWESLAVNILSTNGNYQEMVVLAIDKSINCGENEDLFLALAALRSDSDYMQWFTNGIMWYQCEATVFENCSLFDNEYGTQIKDGHDYHKATVPEILEHFNGTTN